MVNVMTPLLLVVQKIKITVLQTVLEILINSNNNINMRKGLDWHISLMMAVILLIFSVAIFWKAIAGSSPQCKDNIDNDGDGLTDYPADPDCTSEDDISEGNIILEKQGCDTDTDCLGNPNGSKCLQVWPGDINPFCGCISNNDCGVGVCGTNNKCT
jgi:hypothetical protein